MNALQKCHPPVCQEEIHRAVINPLHVVLLRWVLALQLVSQNRVSNVSQSSHVKPLGKILQASSVARSDSITFLSDRKGGHLEAAVTMTIFPFPSMYQSMIAVF